MSVEYDEGDLLNILISPEDLETLLTNKNLGLGIEKNYIFIEETTKPTKTIKG